MQLSHIKKKNVRALFALSTIPMYYREIAEFVYGDDTQVTRAKALVKNLKVNGWDIEVATNTATISAKDVVLANQYYQLVKYGTQDFCRINKHKVLNEVKAVLSLEEIEV